jgi:hypothetical protein
VAGTAIHTAAHLLNGISKEEVCNIEAASFLQKFIHIEQKAAMCDPSFYQAWIDTTNTVNLSGSPAPITSAPSTSLPTVSPEDGGMQHCVSGTT